MTSTALSALETACRQQIRDSVVAGFNPAFTSDEIQDLIGEGINALESFYPAEIVSSLTITASVYTYTVPDTVGEVFRVDIIDGEGALFYDDLDPSAAQGTGGGWMIHAGVLWLPEYLDLTSGYTLRMWGYGPWTYIDSSSDSTATTNLDRNALIAVRKYVAKEALILLANGRSRFQQAQQYPEDTDVGPIAILQYAAKADRRWQEERDRLGALRKSG
jgi:hypothetical protein